jgi:hypothetical protein
MCSKGKYSSEFMDQFKTRASGEVGTTKSCKTCEISSSHGGEYELQIYLLGFTAV